MFHEVEVLAERALTTAKPKEKEGTETGEDSAPSSSSKRSSSSLDPEDAITLRARVIQFKYLTEKNEDDEDGAFTGLKSVVDKITNPDSSDQEYSEGLWELAEHFASPHTSVSSFELLQSGVVDALLQFATEENRKGTLSLWATTCTDLF